MAAFSRLGWWFRFHWPSRFYMLRAPFSSRSLLKASKSNYAHVRRRVFKIADLEDAPYNARSITADALRGLAKSMQQFGVLALPIVNVAHKPPRIVGGHQRVRALREMGETEVECVVVKFDDVTERQANFALNNPHIEGSFVQGLTRELLEELAGHVVDPDLLPSLRLDVLLKQVIRSATASESDQAVKAGKTADDVTPVAQSTAVSKLGSVIALGEHLVHVGRVNAPGDLRVFELDRAEMCFVTATNLSDDASVDAMGVVVRHALSNVSGSVYLATPSVIMPALQALLVESGGYWSNTIVCYGEGAHGKQPFSPADIPVLYGWPAGQAHTFTGGRDQGNVWKLKTWGGSHLPVEAVVRAVQNGTVTGHRVLDVLADGGTTLIACEKTGRRFVGYVSSPREADRVRKRWAEFVHGEGADWRALTAAV